MNQPYLARYATALRSVLGFHPPLKRAREVGHCRRLLDVTPQSLVCALLEALGSLRVTTIADILRTFNAQSGLSTRYKAFHNRLAQPEFPALMRQLYLDILRKFSQNVPRAGAGEQLGRFTEIVLQGRLDGDQAFIRSRAIPVPIRAAPHSIARKAQAITRNTGAPRSAPNRPYAILSLSGNARIPQRLRPLPRHMTVPATSRGTRRRPCVRLSLTIVAPST
ncbi:MAG: hypothetical protein L0191_16350 [Acidobacteria bacterium]|nr:hypothetical protein [Acidobacteriota bacterium]